jgi:hypothetical protein
MSAAEFYVELEVSKSCKIYVGISISNNIAQFLIEKPSPTNNYTSMPLFIARRNKKSLLPITTYWEEHSTATVVVGRLVVLSVVGRFAIIQPWCFEIQKSHLVIAPNGPPLH